MARLSASSENGVKPIKTAVEVEICLKTEYLAILKIDDRNIPDHFQVSSRMDVQRWGHEVLVHAFIPRHFQIFNVFSFRPW